MWHTKNCCNNLLSNYSHEETYIITSFDELINYGNYTSVQHLNETLFTLTISLDEFTQTVVICITDVASDKRFIECGIMRDGDTISLSFDRGKVSKFMNNYVDEDNIKIEKHKAYTVQLSDDKVYNLIIKKDQQTGVREVLLTHQSNCNTKQSMQSSVYHFLKQVISLLAVSFFIYKLYTKFYLFANKYLIFPF